MTYAPKTSGCAENIHGKTQLGPGFRFKGCQFFKRKNTKQATKTSLQPKHVIPIHTIYVMLLPFFWRICTSQISPVGSLGPGCLSHPKMVHGHLGANSQWIYQGHQKMCNQRCCWNPTSRENYPMEPKNGGLEDDFPFQTGDFQVPC